MARRSFALHVKEELCHNSYESLEVKKALLSAYIRINGVVVIRNKHSILSLSNENAKTIKFIYSLILDIYPSNVSISFQKKGNTKTTYTIVVSNNVEDIYEIFYGCSKLEKKNIKIENKNDKILNQNIKLLK